MVILTKAEITDTQHSFREKKNQNKTITRWDQGSTHTKSLLHITFIDKKFWD